MKKLFMATKKVTKKVAKKAATAVAKAVRSDAAKAFMEVMAEYEAKNPEKFAAKKARLEEKLKNL